VLHLFGQRTGLPVLPLLLEPQVLVPSSLLADDVDHCLPPEGLVVELDGLQEVVVDVEDEVPLRGYLQGVLDDGVELLPVMGELRARRLQPLSTISAKAAIISRP